MLANKGGRNIREMLKGEVRVGRCWPCSVVFCREYVPQRI